MCEFISWIEHQGKNYFLTANDLNTKEGRELRKYLGTGYFDDIKGHGAIRRYWGIPDNKGENKECTNFESPLHFPPEIVNAVKKGQFRGIGIAKKLLTQSAWAEYKKIQQDGFWDLFLIPKNRAKKWR